jgi:hypothetical protein
LYKTKGKKQMRKGLLELSHEDKEKLHKDKLRKQKERARL